jgi:glycosyltransferase involved in cell wall biosynthesis
MSKSAAPAAAGQHTKAATGVAVSVIVPVRNGADDLRRLLASLERQTLPRERFEIVVGDDGSTDADVRALATEDGFVRVLSGPPLNSYAARDRAVRGSTAPALAFCDSDCLPAPDWLESGLAALERADLAAGEIRYEIPARPTVWTLIEVDTYKDHARQVAASNAETCNLFVRRRVYDRIGGFDDSLPEHGDFDFVQRAVAAGASLVYEPRALVTHPTRDRARPFLRSVWIYNRWYAAREVRAGRRPIGLQLRSWVPLVQPLRSRLRYGRSLGLDRRRLADHAVRPRLRERLAALPIMYVLLPYVCGAAQLRGWHDGRRLR